jgi:hypothetical protein
MAQPRDEGRAIQQGCQPEGAWPALVKKTYTSPSFVEYGTIAKLTQAGGATAADGPVGFMMSCL